MARLTIYDRRERAIVAAADAALWPLGTIRRALTPRASEAPRRILCLRLERIGDLLMTMPALALLRTLAPGAAIDLVVGSWNREIATAIPDVDRVETLDARWLARGRDACGLPELLSRARRWKGNNYDLAINFEPDVRSNLLLAVSGAREIAGFVSGGGGPLLDVAVAHDPREHTADNAVHLVRSVFGAAPGPSPSARLEIPTDAHSNASRLLRPLGSGPVVALHVSAGREVKQWPEARFHEVAARLITERDAAIVLTGAPDDRAQVDLVKAGLPAERVLDLAGRADLMTLAAIFECVNLLVTGDTGPMHLAQAVGTPIVAIFGPSDPARYAPRGVLDRVVRIDLPCAPCNRIRRPPERCTGHTPDCLTGVDVARVLDAVERVLGDSAQLTERATGAAG